MAPYKFSETPLKLQKESFEVSGSAALNLLAMSTTVRAYLKIFLPLGEFIMRKEKKIGLMNRIGEINIKTWSWNIPPRSGQINLPDCPVSSARVLPHLQTL